MKDEQLKTIFQGMWKRCYRDYDCSYRWYGAKGVRICDEWLEAPDKFEEWAKAELLSTTGSDEWIKGLSIDRIDSDGHYEPDNCRIIPFSENCKTGMSPITVEFDGKEISMGGNEWSEYLGLYKSRVNTIRYRYGEEVAKQFILGELSGHPIELPRKEYTKISKTSTITVNGISDTTTGWAKRLGLTRSRLSVMMHRKGEAAVRTAIEDILNGREISVPDMRKNNGRKPK